MKYCDIVLLLTNKLTKAVYPEENVKYVKVRCVSKKDLNRNKFQVLKVNDYFDISEDEFDSDEIPNQFTSKNVSSGDVYYDGASEEQELNVDLDSIASAEDFGVTTCNSPEGLSDEELTDLQHELGLIAEEFESETPLENTDCIVISDSEEDDNSPEATVVATTTTTVILTLIRKDLAYSDGSMETTRNSTVSYSTGVDPESIDFEHLVMTVIDEIPNHFKKKTSRYTSSNTS
ncbi:unnamed protein product [Mytilus coruscus]|uniref:Uncharacterized protein n=1 Tax=Mytilus coruscus TaxID=42192 RepID=A0A6J8ELH4_MYTCO|nr:unnamed protein product [Mytilus coruscus]